MHLNSACLSVLPNRRPGAPQRLPDRTKMLSWRSKKRFPCSSVPMLGGGGGGKRNVLLLLTSASLDWFVSLVQL